MIDDGNINLKIENSDYKLPVVKGVYDTEKAIDITKLRSKTGYVTLDSGYGNTGACKSDITYIDGDKGILKYRGISIEELALKSTFTEVSYLLIYGELPSKKQLEDFEYLITNHSLIHEDMIKFFDTYPSSSHPMSILSSAVCTLSNYYKNLLDPNDDLQKEALIPRLLSKIRTIATYSYKKSIGHSVIYPNNDLNYCQNILNMMFALPSTEYEIDPDMTKALDILLILHADHEQNCSTSTVRLVGSSGANLFASISAGICALWGPKHGGANQAVIEMLQNILDDGSDVKKFIDMAKDKTSNFRLMGFGHRVYKNYDPRAKIIKKYCDKLLGKSNDPLLEIAKRLEEAALNDPYFQDYKLYPNVDFYSGVIYKALNIPSNMFTVMFALGRLPGWIAHWMEMHRNDNRIGRPRQIYTGIKDQKYIPIEDRI